MNDALLWTLYFTPLALALGIHAWLRQHRETRSRAVLEASIDAGLTEPPSRYPIVDPAVCMGGGACARACPENAIGFINGKAHLVDPTHCIGHGTCAPACPVEAIKLVYGTPQRGMDIPQVDGASFETNVPGIYIAGELGGLGLIGNAHEQGRQAIETIARRRADDAALDVVIVGAGPAGIAATLGAMERKLRFVTLEQEDALGGAVYLYPRNKLVMTRSVTLPLAGRLKLGEIVKEKLLALWQGIADRVKMPVNYNERVEQVTPAGTGFLVLTNRGEYRTRNVLLALGRRGTPRKLGAPGEDLPKVVYRLVDAAEHRGRHVLVVGGGDSAIEAAVALAAEPGTPVTLSYRGDAFGRVKQANRERLAAAERDDRLTVVLNSTVARIEEKEVVLDRQGESIRLANDAVIVCAGGILPTAMLKAMGIGVDTKHGTE